jgi:hypothetical protein
MFALGYPRSRWQVLIVVILASAGLEMLQMVQVTRHGRMTDFLVKAMGGSFGVALAMGLVLIPAIAGKVLGSREVGR